MPETRGQLDDTQRVADLFTYWQLRVKNHNSLDFYSINIVSEDIAAKLINLTYGFQLKNLNPENPHFSAVDLGDDARHIAYQVKSNCETADIYEALEKFQRDHLQRFPRGIRFFILLKDKPPRPNPDKCRKLCSLFDPSAPDAILTGKQLLKDIARIYTPLPHITSGLIGREQELDRLEPVPAQVNDMRPGNLSLFVQPPGTPAQSARAFTDY